MKYIGRDKNNRSEYLGSGKLLLRAIKKYGADNFKKEILEWCTSEDHLNKQEKYWIEYFNAIENNEFYNLIPGGVGGTNEFAIIANRKRKGRPREEYMSPENIIKMDMINRGPKNWQHRDCLDPDVRKRVMQQLREFNTGRPCSESRRENIRYAVLNSQKAKDSHTNPENRNKISVSIQKLWLDPQGIYNSIEYRNKLSHSQLKRWKDNPKTTKEFLVQSLENTNSIASAVKYHNNIFGAISRPTFSKWCKYFNLSI